jgi:hypothetical protein
MMPSSIAVSMIFTDHWLPRSLLEGGNFWRASCLRPPCPAGKGGVYEHATQSRHDDSEANQVIHANLITGMHGDGTPDGTDLTIADPSSGGFRHESFTKFAQRLQAAEPVNFGVGVFHW